MCFKKTRLTFLVVLSLLMLSGAFALAQNKVVVIPLMEDAPPLEPWEPLTAVSPPNSAYTIGTTTVTDNVTGLVWQRTDDNTLRTWGEAWDYCTDNTPGLPGSGWRLPSRTELMSIVYYGTYNEAINSVAFPGTNSLYYWSASTYAVSSDNAWIVYFYNGNVNNNNKSNNNNVRCVR